MYYGYSIVADAIDSLFAKHDKSTSHPLRPGRRNESRSRASRTGSQSFANHPERW
jgi:hypothetical protein